MHCPVSTMAPLHRGLINREIERTLHVLHHPMPALGQLQQREAQCIRRELREQILEEVLEEHREYADMRRILVEEVQQEFDLEGRGVGHAPLILQPPHLPVRGNFRHQDSDFQVTPMDRQEMEIGVMMGIPQVSLYEQLSLLIRPSLEVAPSSDIPTEAFQFQIQARDEQVSNSQQRIVDEELWTEEQLPFMRPFPVNVQDKVEHRSLLQDNPDTVDGNKLVLTERDNDIDTNNIKAKANLSNWKAPGIKRYGQDTVKSSSKKIRTGEESWACAVCHVTPPSEEHLNVHLQGKKHKTRVEKLTLEETSIIKSDASSASKPDNTPKPTLLQAQDGEKVTMKIDGKSHKVIIKTDSVWCDPCMVVCNSREMMVSHLKGKKHIQRMKKLNITEDGAN